MADRIYADREEVAARQEGREVRAKLRGEAPGPTPANDEKSPHIATPTGGDPAALSPTGGLDDA